MGSKKNCDLGNQEAATEICKVENFSLGHCKIKLIKPAFWDFYPGKMKAYLKNQCSYSSAKKMSYLSGRTRVKVENWEVVLRNRSILDWVNLVFQAAPWCLYLIPPVLDPYLLLSRKRAALSFSVDVFAKSLSDRQFLPPFISWKFLIFWLMAT